MKQTIRVGHNGLKLSVHEDHLTLKDGWRGVRINSEDLTHLCGLLTLASGGLRELTQAIEVLSGGIIDHQRDGS